MRLSLVIATAALLATAATVPAQAGAAPQQSCIAVGSGFQHVAAVVARPEDCCTGRMQCSQYLSTTTVVRPAREQRS